VWIDSIDPKVGSLTEQFCDVT